MTLKERVKLLEDTIKDYGLTLKGLQTHILNHTSVHMWDRIIRIATLLAMTTIIVLLKFKII